MFLTIFFRFFLIRIRETPDRVELFDLLNAREVLIKCTTTTARLISVLGLLFPRCGIAGSWCASKT